jgi:hypothetical protein
LIFRLKKNYERYLLEYEYKSFPDHRLQALELEKQQQLKKSASLENISGQSGSPPSSPVLAQHLPLSPRQNLRADKWKAKKNKKKSSNDIVKDVLRDKMGMPKLPQTFGELTLENLGVIIAKSPYVSDKHVYPIGFSTYYNYYAYQCNHIIF